MLHTEKSVLITDFDNTLFDWVEMWTQSFRAMLEAIVQDSQIPRDTLIKEIQQVHMRHGTAEYAFLMQELPALQAKHAGKDIVSLYSGAIDAYREARRKSLAPYPTVIETLQTLRNKGCLIVAYTESMAFYSAYRIRKLGLDGLIDFLYSPADHDLPQNLTTEQLRHYPKEHYKFTHTQHKYTPPNELKPNPKLLLDIINDIGANPKDCVYLGDNLHKDVKMAQMAGVTDVHALYGKAFHKPEYKLLVEVTHWTTEQVEREKALGQSGEVTPTHVLKNHMAEILDHFDFRPFTKEEVQHG